MTFRDRNLADYLRADRVDTAEHEGPVVEVVGVRLRFGGLTVLDDVSFHVAHSELFAIIGPNGAGKTSIFNCLSGVYVPESGSVRLLGRDVLGLKPHRIAAMGMARTFQNVELFEHLTVLDNLMLGRHLHVGYGWAAAMAFLGKASREERRHREVAEEIIEFLEIEAYRKSLVGMLPFGVLKRVELGRALAMEPVVLMLDEPVAGMNLEETEDMARFVLDIRDELGIAMILVEHDMRMVMDLADRVLVLDLGAAVSLGTPAEVQNDPNVIRAYLGEEHEIIGGSA
jgi:branched-chain amino acid transport system ATP-binding protein